MKKTIWLSAILFFAALAANAQVQKPPPIIDMHLHAISVNDFGPPPVTLGAPFKMWGAAVAGEDYSNTFDKALKNGSWNKVSVISPKTDDELEQATIEILRKRNVYGILSGSVQRVRKWKKAEPKHIINAVYWDYSHIKSEKLDADSLRQLFKTGEFKVFSEVAIQYEGLTVSDRVFEPYLKMAEDRDIPMGVHTGPGPPGAPYLGTPHYRARMHSPFVMEEALTKHPKLRVYAMHSGWPMLDDMMAMLYTYPELYVDLAVIDYILPKKEFYSYLKRLVDAGFGERIMYGSDQMIWPQAMEKSIDNIPNAPFLSESKKRDIFFNNAARFLELTPQQIKDMQ